MKKKKYQKRLNKHPVDNENNNNKIKYAIFFFKIQGETHKATAALTSASTALHQIRSNPHKITKLWVNDVVKKGNKK